MTPETVLITGASSGLGVEFARIFASQGSNLVLVARRQDRLEALAAELRAKHNVIVAVFPQDLSAPDAARTIFDACTDANLAIDVLVNNAGFGAIGEFAASDEPRAAQMIQVNIAALTSLTRLFLQGMLQRRRGGILNVASTAAFQPGPLMSVYYATKSYVLSFSEALWVETRGSGVRVSCLCPGPTTTEFVSAAGMKPSLLFALATMSAEKAARIGVKGFRKGRAICVPGLINKLTVVMVKFAPRWITRRVMKWVNGFSD